MKTRISKAYRGKQHIGWKKTVGGREWFLGYGTSPADEAKAIRLAEVLEAKWKLIRASGGDELSQTDFEEAKDLVAGQLRWTSARDGLRLAVSTPDPLPAPVTPAAATAEAPRSAVVAADPQSPRRWLYACIDEFVATTK